MLPRVCQLKTLWPFAFILIISCSGWRKQPPPDDQEIMSVYESKWFSQNENHALMDSDGKVSPNLFFDISPGIGENKKVVNVILTTPEKSPHAYQVDYVSGQRHYSHSYCDQKDIWKNEGGSVGSPSFSIGYLPRVLDQMGEPQKVMIFGRRNTFAGSLNLNYFNVRIVGGYIEETCPDGNCMGRDVWNNRLVFLAVNPLDEKFSKIEELDELIKVIDWKKVQAEIENLDGRNSIGDHTYPHLRIKRKFGVKEAQQYFKNRSVYFTQKEMDKVQNSCHTLYDKLWSEVGAQRPEDSPATTSKELREKLKLKEEFKSKKRPFGFAARLEKFNKKYHREMATCEKFVYHGNINKDPERFWFLSYMGIYYRLHKEGFYFDCETKIWQKNLINMRGDTVFDLGKSQKVCTERDLDTAMNYLPNFLKAIKSTNVWYYKFIDYDTHPFGTHSKLYSWVKVKNRKFECRNDPNESISKAVSTFPEEVSWKNRHVNDIQDELKIIE